MNDRPPKIDISDEMIAERRGGSGKMPDDMPKWMAKSITSIDKFSKITGNVVCWILMPLILAIPDETIGTTSISASGSIFSIPCSNFSRSPF